MLHITNLTNASGEVVLSKTTGEPVEVASAPLAVTGRFDWTDEQGKRTAGYKASYLREDGSRVDARYSIYVAINDSNTLTTEWALVNFWGEAHAREIENALENQGAPVTATLELISARVSRYDNKHNGERTFSLNFNDDRGYDILKLAEQGTRVSKWESALAALFA